MSEFRAAAINTKFLPGATVRAKRAKIHAIHVRLDTFNFFLYWNRRLNTWRIFYDGNRIGIRFPTQHMSLGYRVFWTLRLSYFIRSDIERERSIPRARSKCSRNDPFTSVQNLIQSSRNDRVEMQSSSITIYNPNVTRSLPREEERSGRFPGERGERQMNSNNPSDGTEVSLSAHQTHISFIRSRSLVIHALSIYIVRTIGETACGRIN